MSLRFACVAHSRPLFANMTSSTAMSNKHEIGEDCWCSSGYILAERAFVSALSMPPASEVVIDHRLASGYNRADSRAITNLSAVITR